MKIVRQDHPPEEIIYHEELEEKLSEQEITDVAEIFQTPLSCSYNWDYTIADNRIMRLYELGKKLNWNGSVDVDWDVPFSTDQYNSREEFRQDLEQIPSYRALSEAEKIKYDWHDSSWALSQFLHGEQGALLVASQLVSCAPTYSAKLYAASQTFDEARHVEVFNRYLQQRIGFTTPISPWLKFLLDKILTDQRWDLKFIGMQLVIEGLALAAFNSTKMATLDPLLKQIVHYIIRDEARHVTFGVNYLEEFIHTLSEEEKEERAQFAFEACKVSKERLINTHTPQLLLGVSEEEAREFAIETSSAGQFRSLLFSRIMPNLKRIGLLTDKVMPKFEELGVLGFVEQPSDWEIDWVQMEKPLEDTTLIDQESEAMFQQMHSAIHGSDQAK